MTTATSSLGNKEPFFLDDKEKQDTTTESVLRPSLFDKKREELNIFNDEEIAQFTQKTTFGTYYVGKQNR